MDSISPRCVWLEEQLLAALQPVVEPRSPDKQAAPAAANDSAAPQVGAAQRVQAMHQGLPMADAKPSTHNTALLHMQMFIQKHENLHT